MMKGDWPVEMTWQSSRQKKKAGRSSDELFGGPVVLSCIGSEKKEKGLPHASMILVMPTIPHWLIFQGQDILVSKP